MAAFTSAQAGNWSDDATWTGSGVPGNGDTVTISHSVTVDVNTTAGASLLPKPYTTPVLSATAGSGTTFLPTGNYRVAYSFVSPGGETCMSLEVGPTTFTRGTSKPRLTVPALPAGYTSINVYVTAAGGASGSETRFCTGVTGTTIDLIGADDGASASYWENAQGGDGNDAVGGTVPRASAAAPQPQVAAILINAAAGALTVANGVTLTVRGDVNLKGTINLIPGCVWKWDASQAYDPTNQNYGCDCNGNATAPFANLQAPGTSGSRITITSDASGGNGFFTSPVNRGIYVIKYCDVTSIGTASLPAFLSNPSVTPMGVTVQFCTFSGCGIAAQVNATHGTDIATFEDSQVTNSLAANSLQLGATGSVALTAGGSRSIQRNSFDAIVHVETIRDFTIKGNYFGGGMANIGTVAWTEFSGNFLRITAATAPVIMHGDYANNYVFSDAGTAGGHSIGSAPHGVATINITDNVYEVAELSVGSPFHNSQDGHTWPTTLWTLSGNLVLPCGGAFAFVLLSDQVADADLTFACVHNTVIEYLVVCETENIGTGTFTTFKSNLCWSPSAGTGYLFNNTFAPSGSQNTDVVSGANADYNGGYQLAAGSQGKGYNTPMTASPGAHDVDGQNPNFVDSTRNIMTWGTMKGADGSLAAALALIAADPALIFDAGDATTLIPWVRAGFAPRNQAIKAAHDNVSPTNGWIGAVAGVSAGNPYYAYAQQ